MHLKIYQPLGNLVKASKFWQNNYLVLREFKHFRKVALFAVIFSVLAAAFEGFSIGFLLTFLQSLTNAADAEPIQTGISWFDIWILGINTSATSRMYRISILILLSTWLRSGFDYFSSIYTESAQLHLADRLRKRMFEHLQALPLSYFVKTRSGELINTITTEIERLKQGFGGVAFVIIRGMAVAVYFVTMFLISWELSIVSVLLFALLGVGLSTLNARVRESSFGISNANGAFHSTATEFINGIRTVHASGTQDFERQRFYSVSGQLLNASIKVAKAWTLVKPIASAIATTAIIGLIILSFSVFTLPVASLLTFFFVLMRVVPSIQDINGTIAFLSTLNGSLDNVKQLLESDSESYFQNGSVEFTKLNRSIDVVSVDFGYEPSNLVLHNITLTLEKGKTTALVGASGAGKTTLADLIPRFYDPTQGHIHIDGVDLKDIDIYSLRKNMAVVSQDTFIFNTSVWNNIAYGTEHATEAEIKEAARLANALKFIEDMPQGFNTKLGDRGVRLSGGQRQRIAIARALLRDPQILILDEATSALDSVSERLIQESLEKLSVGRTVVAIAHRLSTIAKADKVVVMEGGYIVEQGKYQDLLKQRGKLWKYHQMQNEVGQTS
ncbi:ABC transporter, transmembrane region [Calothrix parasitica NIES-267]|uniref:ABC transporter, transmembrane region n=1 Tax=Calothrix parasitica NIES-267 TaxID=1973488 RepID=A0A1Z4LKR1_9CYAN|nr:ABC transporter, transmembrane region [Calothrix parasitica NIES-267]